MASSGVGVQGRMALPLHQNHILVTHSRRVAGQESMLEWCCFTISSTKEAEMQYSMLMAQCKRRLTTSCGDCCEALLHLTHHH